MLMLLKKIIVRFLAMIGFLTLLPLLALIIFAIFHIKPSEKIPHHAVLSLDLNRSIVEAPDQDKVRQLFAGRSMSMFEITHALDEAAKDPDIKALSVRADTISFGPGQLQEFRDAVLRFRSHGKIATIHVDTFGELTPANFLYYLATAFDQIWIQPTGYLNMTGLYAEVPFLAQALEDIGIKVRISQRKEYKTAYSFLTDKDFTPANAEQTKDILKGIFSELISGISTDRKITPEKIKQVMAESPLMTVAQAQSLGLVDALGYLDTYEQFVLKHTGEKSQFFPLSKYIERLKSNEKSLLKNKPIIALIYGVGVIQRGMQKETLFDEQFITPEKMRRAFDAALKNPKVKAIVFRIDSPGGSAVASDAVSRLIVQAHLHKIPVIASMGNVAASGGYWIAAGCTRIVAQPMTLTGSIGVFAGKVVVSGLLDKLKISLGAVSEGPNGSFWSVVQDYTDQQWGFLQHSLDSIYNQFLRHVAQGRNLPMQQIEQVAKGRVWTGREAKARGLVDEIGGIEKAIKLARVEAKIPADQEVQIMVFPQTRSVYERLLTMFDHDSDIGSNVFSELYQMASSLVILLKTQFSSEPVLANLPVEIK